MHFRYVTHKTYILVGMFLVAGLWMGAAWLYKNGHTLDGIHEVVCAAIGEAVIIAPLLVERFTPRHIKVKHKGKTGK